MKFEAYFFSGRSSQQRATTGRRLNFHFTFTKMWQEVGAYPFITQLQSRTNAVAEPTSLPGSLLFV